MEEKLKHDLDEIAKVERAKIEKQVKAAHEKEHQKKIGAVEEKPKEEAKKTAAKDPAPAKAPTPKPAPACAADTGAKDKKKALLDALKKNDEKK